MRSYKNLFPSSEIYCKILEGRDRRMLAWHCFEPKNHNERLLELGKDLYGPHLIRLVSDLRRRA